MEARPSVGGGGGTKSGGGASLPFSRQHFSCRNSRKTAFQQAGNVLQAIDVCSSLASDVFRCSMHAASSRTLQCLQALQHRQASTPTQSPGYGTCVAAGLMQV